MNYNTVFEKVSFEQFKKDIHDLYYDCPDDNYLHAIYNAIKLPERGTKDSAGYDFFIPFGIDLHVGSSITIPTGIRCKMKEDNFLMLCPRSSMGFKYNLSLADTVGIIDSDYYNADNEGHILVKLVYNGFFAHTEISSEISNNPHATGINFACREFPCDGEKINRFKPKKKINNKPIILNQGDKFVQGIIMPYFTTDNDITLYIREGGIGSTGH